MYFISIGVTQEIENLGVKNGSNKNGTTLPTPIRWVARGIAALRVFLFHCLTKMNVSSLLNVGTVKPNRCQIALYLFFFKYSLFLILRGYELSDYIYLILPLHTSLKQ